MVRADKVSEAALRMRKLKLPEYIIEAFISNNTVPVFSPPLGLPKFLSADQKKLVSDFENENNAVVYAVVRSYTPLGNMDSMLYVSDYIEDWNFEHEDIEDKCPMTYTYNYDVPDFSEFGSIMIKLENGGLIRTA